MTSGQSGPYGDQGQQGQPGPPPGQGGPPQGWNAPPPQQPYGQQPNYGQQYPGYAPAPSAPTGHGAPPAMERPQTVRIGIGALVASLIIGLIASIVTFSDVDGLIDQTLQTSTDPALTEEVIRSSLIIGVVIGLIITALQILFLWFAWKGHNWARIVIFVLGGISLVFGLIGLAAGTNESTGFLTSLGWFQLILTAVGIVALALKPSSEWYRFRGWQRANGQG